MAKLPVLLSPAVLNPNEESFSDGRQPSQMESCLSALRALVPTLGVTGHPHDPASSHLDCSNGKRESGGVSSTARMFVLIRDGATLSKGQMLKQRVKWCIAVYCCCFRLL